MDVSSAGAGSTGPPVASEAVASTLGAPLPPPTTSTTATTAAATRPPAGSSARRRRERAGLAGARAVGLDALAQREGRHRLRHGGGDERTASLGELLVEGVHGYVLVGGNHGLSL